MERFTMDWEFLLDSTGFTHPGEVDSLNGSNWEMVDLPHTARIEPLVVNDQWQGNCWYRKEINYDDAWKDRRVLLRFEGAMHVATVWINTKKAADHAGGYLPFTVDITDHLLPGETNRVYVRLNNEDNPLTGPKPLEILDFNMYGGLYRDVLLITKNRVHITDEQLAETIGSGGVFVSMKEVTPEKALVEVRVQLANTGPLDQEVQLSMDLEREGAVLSSVSLKPRIEAGKKHEISAILEVENPGLWSPGDPVLHDLHLVLSDGATELDSYHHRIGIRKIAFEEGRLFINGKETFLRGVNRHQEYPYIGYALSDQAQHRDARKIKEAGFDYVRLSHYPHSPAFMDACDELGILTVNAILGWQYYNPDQRFRQQVFSDARHLLRRDRNHACVLAWELSLNESGMPHDLIDTLCLIAREEYPAEGCFTAGWLEYGYDIYLQARQHRVGHESSHTEKPYIVSEYGDWEYYAMNAGLKQDDWGDLLQEHRSSRQLLGESDTRLLQQAFNVQEAHNDNLSTPALADGYWVMFDYNRGYADDLEASGVMSIFRQPKFTYDFFRSQRGPEEKIAGEPLGPVLSMASRMMNDKPESLKVYSNCSEVELWVNGRSLGKQWPDRDRISGNLAHPPFTFKLQGEILNEVIAAGSIEGEEVIRSVVYAPGEAARIELKADISGLPAEAGCRDAIFVHARLLDSRGQLVPDGQKEIRFTLSGDAEIVGNSRPPMEAGIAAILIRIGRTPGTLSLSVEAEGLEQSTLEIEVIPPKAFPR